MEPLIPIPPRRAKRVPQPCWVGASRPFTWRQRLSWLISALSGTVEVEEEIAWLREQNDKEYARIERINTARRLRNSSLNPQAPAENDCAI